LKSRFAWSDGSRKTANFSAKYIQPTKERPFAYELILLKNYPKYETAVDGDFVGTIAYQIGTYVYTTVNGSSKTIHIYTTDFDTAISYEETKEIGAQ